MATVGQRMSVEEYLALPEGEKPYREYVDGEVIEKALPDYRHVGLIQELGARLWLYQREHGGFGGPEPRIEFPDVDHTNFRLPDLAYWTPTTAVRGLRAMRPPTLAIEVRSPDERMNAQRAKCRFFRNHGVPVAWLVDPDSRTVEVFEAERDGAVLREGDALESPELPGFRLPVGELFAILDIDGE
jgi:Uma2 family endonuclease